jgi:hypothetical protein
MKPNNTIKKIRSKCQKLKNEFELDRISINPTGWGNCYVRIVASKKVKYSIFSVSCCWNMCDLNLLNKLVPLDKLIIKEIIFPIYKEIKQLQEFNAMEKKYEAI